MIGTRGGTVPGAVATGRLVERALSTAPGRYRSRYRANGAWFDLLSISSLPLSGRFVWRKGQQDVARHGAESRIAGIDEDHSSHDDDARAIERSTAALDAVHGFIIADSVEIPKKSPVLSREGPQVTVER